MGRLIYFVIAFVVCIHSFEHLSFAGEQKDSRPNLLLIMTDDQDVTAPSFEVMKTLQSLMIDKGVTFTNMFTDYPLCCPSRATFLTGQRAANHDVRSNDPPRGGYPKLNHQNTLAVWLQAAGYHTAIVGKHLNGYGLQKYGLDPYEVPPGWNLWHVPVNDTSFYNYTVNENGKLFWHGFLDEDYATDEFTERALQFLREQKDSAEPFFLWLSYWAPHDAARSSPVDPRPGFTVPARRHTYISVPALLKKPSFNEKDVSDKPAIVRRAEPFNSEFSEKLNMRYQLRLRSLLAVDEGIERMFVELARIGKLHNTVFIFLSDNGYLQGEHRYYYKGVPYEEALRVPLVIRGAGFSQHEIRTEMVSNVDLAPTIVQLTNAQPKRIMDGHSLLPLLKGKHPLWRTAFVFEGSSDAERHQFYGFRTERYKYVEYEEGGKELYDLKLDPFEMENKYGKASYKGIADYLAFRLNQLKHCTGEACWVTERLDLLKPTF